MNYSYDILTEITSAKLFEDRLKDEIENSSITVSLDGVGREGSTLNVIFASAISAGEKTELDALVRNHSGEPYPEEQTSQLVHIDQEDPETGGLAVSPKWAKDGWKQQMFEIEYNCSTLNSIHEKDLDNNDIGWASMKFYKDDAGSEVEITGGDLNQTFLDANCIRTDLLWMPTSDYQIKGGQIAQNTIPTEDVYIWAVGADLDAIYGGPQITFLEGGLNLAFAPSNELMGMDGVAASLLEYSHPLLGDGKGTNRIRFINRHSAGFQHRLQAVFELFIDPANWT